VKDTDIKHIVGLKVKKYRQNCNLTQFKLGELIDINQRQVAQIECGKSFPSLSTLIKLSQVLQHDISDFFESEKELGEVDLKRILTEKIKKAGYDDCKRILTVIKTFTDI